MLYQFGSLALGYAPGGPQSFVFCVNAGAARGSHPGVTAKPPTHLTLTNTLTNSL